MHKGLHARIGKQAVETHVAVHAKEGRHHVPAQLHRQLAAGDEHQELGDARGVGAHGRLAALAACLQPDRIESPRSRIAYLRVQIWTLKYAILRVDVPVEEQTRSPGCIGGLPAAGPNRIAP